MPCIQFGHSLSLEKHVNKTPRLSCGVFLERWLRLPRNASIQLSLTQYSTNNIERRAHRNQMGSSGLRYLLTSSSRCVCNFIPPGPLYSSFVLHSFTPSLLVPYALLYSPCALLPFACFIPPVLHYASPTLPSPLSLDPAASAELLVLTYTVASD